LSLSGGMGQLVGDVSVSALGGDGQLSFVGKESSMVTASSAEINSGGLVFASGSSSVSQTGGISLATREWSPLQLDLELRVAPLLLVPVIPLHPLVAKF
jgi:hypothetical protein